MAVESPLTGCLLMQLRIQPIIASLLKGRGEAIIKIPQGLR